MRDAAMITRGIGLDLVDVQRFEALYRDEQDGLDRCFSVSEQQAVGTGSDRYQRLAARFAAKEAVLKTIGGIRDGIAFTDIEIRSDGVSAPTVELSGGALLEAKTRGIESWDISLSHLGHVAAAVALALSGPR